MTANTSFARAFGGMRDDAEGRLVYEIGGGACRSYELGASSFITKPVTFPALVEVMNGIGSYWFELVELPT